MLGCSLTPHASRLLLLFPYPQPKHAKLASTISQQRPTPKPPTKTT